jgi:Enoyl-CoA hydratase/isomerase
VSDLDEEKFWPILEAAEALGVPIYIHPRSPGSEMAPAFKKYGLETAPGDSRPIPGCTANASSVLLPRLVGAKAMRLVLESARFGAEDALAIGLLDQIVGEADLIQTAVGIVHRWTAPGAATAAHLGLLRPPLPVIEQAFAAETEVTRSAEAAGLASGGISRFLSRRPGAGS